MKSDPKKDKKYITLAELATLSGNSRQAVYLAKDTGAFPTLTVSGKTKVDPDNIDVKAYIAAAHERKQSNTVDPAGMKSPKNQKSVGPTGNKQGKNKESGGQEADIPAEILEKLESGGLTNQMILTMPKAWIEKLKMYEHMKQIKQKREQERKNLISRRLVRIILGKMYEIDVNEYLTLKSKIIPDLAGIYGVTDPVKNLEAERKIDEHLYAVLNHIKIEIDKFLSSQGEKPLE